VGAFLGAFAIVFIRRISASEHSETIVFYYSVTCLAAGALTMLWHFEPFTPFQFLLLCGVGMFGGLNQICLTFCYRCAEPSLVAPFDYLAMVWAVTLGYFIFGEVPSASIMWGASIVIAAGVIVALRQRFAGRVAR
jgi:drug/metabolite transporter (DMT)-like permease